jgi:hypothetical protein
MRHGFTVGLLGAAVLLLTTGGIASAQNPVVSHPTSSALSPALADLPTAHWAPSSQGLKLAPPPKPLRPRGAGPGGASSGDAALQREPGPDSGIQPKANFGGIGANGYIPPDPNIAVGKNTSCAGVGCIVQVVNSQIAVFNKSGGLVTGPVSLSSLWSGLPGGGGCATNDAGDPVVQYDVVADRWLVSQLGSTSGPTYSECIAVSQTSDPSHAYNLYSYSFDTSLNDYPKFGVWPTTTNSAYLASYNMFTNGQFFAGSKLCAYDRAAMLAGTTSPTQICLTLANDGNYLPADLDGATPPSPGTPAYFLNFEPSSSLRLQMVQFDFAAGTATPSPATDIPVTAFNEACGGGTCIAQPNSQKLDSLGDRLMYRLAYRNFSDHAAMVVNHSVTAGSSVGVRWYELRQPTGGAFSLYQQGTFAPDSAYRWMGSAAMDGAGNIALGYSESSGSVNPSIAFTSRTPDITKFPLGTMGAETILQAGGGAQTTYSPWGDYTSLRIDPDDDTTFWYTNEYYTHGGPFNFTWNTAIGSFTAAGAVPPPDFSIAPLKTSLTVTRGSSNSTTFTVTSVNASSSVKLSVSNLPKGASASFSPNPVTAITTGAPSTLTISVSRAAKAGIYGSVVITGSNGSATHTATLQLTIQ